jgi:phage-related tail fiber protein
MRLGSNIYAEGLTITNLDPSIVDGSSACRNDRVSNVAGDLNAQIAALDAQFSAAVNNLDIKDACLIAALDNVDIATGGLLTLQDTTLVAGDRVLLTAQTDRTENGPYVAAAGAWVRTDDADTNTEVTAGMAVPISGGDLDNRTLWLLTTRDPIVVDTTDLTFTRSRSPYETTVAGGGLDLNPAHILSLIGTPDRVSVSGPGIDIATNYAGQDSITDVGNITGAAAQWNGQKIAIERGGTGETTVAGAKAAFGIPEEISMTIGNGSDTEYLVSHGLNNTKTVFVKVMRLSDNEEIKVGVKYAPNNVTVKFDGAPPSANSYEVSIMGVKKPFLG